MTSEGLEERVKEESEPVELLPKGFLFNYITT